MLSFIFSIFVMSFSDSSPQKIPKGISKEKVEKTKQLPQKEISFTLDKENRIKFRSDCSNLIKPRTLTGEKISAFIKEKKTNDYSYVPDKIPKQENKIL